MSDESYTIDDVIEACIRAERQGRFEGQIRFYLHMAYALGMGFQPSPRYAQLAELDRLKEIKGVSK